MKHYLFQVAFVWYPYVCFTVFLLGSLIRFDRDPYTWRASSSQILRKRQLFWGSNLFHFGILFLLLGHTVGLLTPTELYTLVITVQQKQMTAVAAGGLAGTLCFIGLTMLLHRRHDPGRASDLQGPSRAGHDDLPAVPIHPAGSRLERAGLVPRPPRLSGGPQP